MSNNQAVWPDLVFASLLMLAGILMLRYGVWHLVHHHEVVSPLLAGSGALVLGALSIRQILQSRSRHRHRLKARHPSDRTRWWFWAIVVVTSATGFASAQIQNDSADRGETAAVCSVSSKSTVPIQNLPRKHDLDRVRNRGIIGDFDLQSLEREQKIGERLPVEIDQKHTSLRRL
jgi:phosphate/sulfate permease